MKRHYILHSTSIWETNFIEVRYYLSPTAQSPLVKIFKRFPVDPTQEYLIEIKKGFEIGDFNLLDVLCEIINFQYELEEMKLNYEINTSQEHEIYFQSMKIMEQCGITLR
jgi:hypothetical protein